MAKKAEAYVVNNLCQDCLDTACAQVCPVDCFYEPVNPNPDLPAQLYIDPETCINCNACVPECPWEAITSGDDVPDIFESSIDLNAKVTKEKALFKLVVIRKWQVCPQCRSRTADGQAKCQCNVPLAPFHVRPDELKANKDKWGYSG